MDAENLPRHIAIIMDGNGRWAKKRGLPRTAGHSVGAETFRKIANYCKEIGIEYFTVYAFSTENWKRPKEEVDSIMRLLERYLKEALSTMERDKVKIRFWGDTSVLSPKLKELIARTHEKSEQFDGVQTNICLNYGGRDEIMRAAQLYAQECIKDGFQLLTEEKFSSYMYSAGVPEPDLIIRPSGEERLSNFLMWQAAYSEFYYTDVLWPDFNEKELDKAIIAYQNRNRRYGGVK